jgi:uncharacterized repeat protein (TIGR01451 family)
LLAGGGFALATEEQPLRSELEAYLVEVDADGKEVLRPAEETEPGSVVEYRLNFTNLSADPIAELAVNGPVPASTTYLGQTAITDAQAHLVVSIDGGRSYEPEPVVRSVHEPDGTIRHVVVPPSRYTHIRWLNEQSLESNATASYRYRVRVDGPEPSSTR